MRCAIIGAALAAALVSYGCNNSKANAKTDKITHSKTQSTNMANEVTQPTQDIYGINIKDIKGDAIDLSTFKGKKILFVNVASRCGFTPQYKELQKLHEQYKDKLVVIGVPCNQFGGQEPGTSEEIQQFCKINYGVDFLITEKINVKGAYQHDLYKWLTDKAINGNKSSEVKWNFQKYLVDESGNLVDVFLSAVEPMGKEITEKL